MNHPTLLLLWRDNVIEQISKKGVILIPQSGHNRDSIILNESVIEVIDVLVPHIFHVA